eukprot:COSAG01_NODE_61_length_29729_cov_196.711779_8_plen_33_part_00
MAAVNQDGRALAFASEQLRGDVKFVEAANKKD